MSSVQYDPGDGGPFAAAMIDEVVELEIAIHAKITSSSLHGGGGSLSSGLGGACSHSSGTQAVRL